MDEYLIKNGGDAMNNDWAEQIKIIENSFNTISNTMDDVQPCVSEIQKINESFRRQYVQMIQEERMEEAFGCNRKWFSLMRKLNKNIQEPAKRYYFELGTLSGMYVAYSGMIPDINEKRVFEKHMSYLLDNKYVRETINCLYNEHTLQNKQLCERISISAPQLNRVTTKLHKAGCVNRYQAGKNVFWQLTKQGFGYAHSVLNCGKQTVVIDTMARWSQGPEEELTDNRFNEKYMVDQGRTDSYELEWDNLLPKKYNQAYTI